MRIFAKKADYLDALGDLYINDHGHSMLNLATDRLEDTPQIRDEKWKAWLAEKERNIAEGRKLKRQAKIARQASEVWKNKDTGACRNINQVIRGSPKKELVEIAAIKYRERRGAIGSQERREFIRFAQLLYEAVTDKRPENKELVYFCDQEIKKGKADHKGAAPQD